MSNVFFLAPAQAGAQRLPLSNSTLRRASKRHWVPAFAATTSREAAL